MFIFISYVYMFYIFIYNISISFILISYSFINFRNKPIVTLYIGSFLSTRACWFSVKIYRYSLVLCLTELCACGLGVSYSSVRLSLVGISYGVEKGFINSVEKGFINGTLWSHAQLAQHIYVQRIAISLPFILQYVF